MEGNEKFVAVNILTGHGQASKGAKGCDGTGGQHGKHGKAAGDVGYIDQVALIGNWTYDPYSFGFGSDEALEIHYHYSAPKGSYARCDLYCGSERYADIRYGKRQATDVQQGTQDEKTQQGRVKKEKNEAAQKKSIAQSHVKQYARQVMDRNEQVIMEKQMANQLNSSENSRKIFGLTETDENQIDAKASQKTTGVMKTHCPKFDVPQYHRNDDSSIRTATGIYSEHQNDTAICNDCRPIVLDEDDLSDFVKQLQIAESNFFDEKELLGRCLVCKSDSTGDDANNILHCIFGQSGDDNTNERRKQLAIFVEKWPDNVGREILRAAIESFVLTIGNRKSGAFPLAKTFYERYGRLRKLAESEQQTRWNQLGAEMEKAHNKKIKAALDDRIALEIQDRKPTLDDRVNLLLQLSSESFSELLPNLDQNVLIIIEILLNPLKTFWEEVMRSDKLLKEYGSFIRSPVETLGEPELELLAMVNKIKVHVYCEDQESGLSLQRTINSQGDDEFYVLKKSDGHRFARLEVDQWQLSFEKKRKISAAFDRSIYQEQLNRLIDERFKMLSKNGTEGM